MHATTPQVWPNGKPHTAADASRRAATCSAQHTCMHARERAMARLWCPAPSLHTARTNMRRTPGLPASRRVLDKCPWLPSMLEASFSHTDWNNPCAIDNCWHTVQQTGLMHTINSMGTSMCTQAQSRKPSKTHASHKPAGGHSTCSNAVHGLHKLCQQGSYKTQPRRPGCLRTYNSISSWTPNTQN